MAWIESHQELLRHKKTLRLARFLGASLPQVIGHLHILWWWALDYAPTGDLSDLSAADITEAAHWDGDSDLFLQALIDSGFVDSDEEGLTLHDWHEYAGRLIERRKADAERKRKSQESRRASAGTPQELRRMSDGVPTESAGSRTDSIRNSNRNLYSNSNQKTERQSLVASGEATSDLKPFEADFAEAWAAYPRKESRATAYRAYVARRRAGASKEDLLSATQIYARLVAAKGTELAFIKLGQTFYGPGDHWKELLQAEPDPERESVTASAGSAALVSDELAIEIHEAVAPTVKKTQIGAWIEQYGEQKVKAAVVKMEDLNDRDEFIPGSPVTFFADLLEAMTDTEAARLLKPAKYDGPRPPSTDDIE